jgi:hypothetical protein
VAQKRAKELEWDDSELFSLRLEGKLRLWGRRGGAILYLLWFDPEHLVCPSRKKDT